QLEKCAQQSKLLPGELLDSTQLLQTCQLFEVIECYPEAPPGAALTAAHTSLAVASLFLPKDDRHITWARRKFARIEQLGYIHAYIHGSLQSETKQPSAGTSTPLRSESRYLNCGMFPILSTTGSQ